MFSERRELQGQEDTFFVELQQEVQFHINRLDAKQQPGRFSRLVQQGIEVFVPFHSSRMEAIEKVLALRDLLPKFDRSELSAAEIHTLDILITQVDGAYQKLLQKVADVEKPEQELHDQVVAWKWNKYVRTKIGVTQRFKDLRFEHKINKLRNFIYLPENFSGSWGHEARTEHDLFLLSLLCPERLCQGGVTAADVRIVLDDYAKQCEQMPEVFVGAHAAKQDWQAYTNSQLNKEKILEDFDPYADVIVLPEDRFEEVRLMFGTNPIEEKMIASGFYLHQDRGASIVLHMDRRGSDVSVQSILAHELGHYIRDELDNELEYRIFDEAVVEATSRETTKLANPIIWSVGEQEASEIYMDERVITQAVVPDLTTLFFATQEEQLNVLMQGLRISDPEKLQEFHTEAELVITQADKIRKTDRKWSNILNLFKPFAAKWGVHFQPKL